MLFDKTKFDLDAVFSDNSKALHFFSTQPKFNHISNFKQQDQKFCFTLLCALSCKITKLINQEKNDL